MIGRYLLLGRLGAGGMGVVYLAEHPGSGIVALKTPHAEDLNDPTLRARFAEEVAFSRRVVPFCTAAVIEDGTDGDRPYLVTEYIPGPALSQVVQAYGPLTPDLAYGVALGVAAALVAVHDAALVHRDLKPGNVLLSTRGPRVIDFGIARDVDTLAAHTQAGQVMGSPGWVAPERLTGGPAVPASDVFAWGCLIAFAATGHHPFGGGEPEALARRILLEPPRIDSVPALLRPAVAAALAKDPLERPRSGDLLRALLAGGGIGDPWDLRAAVNGVLEETWTPVPHPPAADRVHPASPLARLSSREPLGRSPAGDGGTPSGGGSAAGAGARANRSRRGSRSKGGAPLSHAGFAALATVSIAAVTVFAAYGGEGLSIGGSQSPDNPQVVRSHGTADSTLRPAATLTGAIPSARTRVTATPTVSVTRTRTLTPFTVLTPRPDRRATIPPADDDPHGDPGGQDPEDCVSPAGSRRGNAARRDCPQPSVSISTIPQDGPGESPPPSPSGPPTPTATVTASP